MTDARVAPFKPMSIGRVNSDSRALAIMATIWLLMTILANPIGDFPLNDDWVYALAVKSVLTTGHFQLPSPSSANVGPQVYWGALFCFPFGFSYSALRCSTLVLGFVGILGLYGIVLQLTNNRLWALCCGLVLATNPIYFAVSNSFMTDIPFLAMVIASYFYMIKGFISNNPRYLVIGVIITGFAILIRQLAILGLLAYVVAYLVKYGFRPIRAAKLAILLTAGTALHVGFQYWLIHTGRTPVLVAHSDIHYLLSFTRSGWYMRSVIFNSLNYIGLFLLPLVIVFILSNRDYAHVLLRDLLKSRIAAPCLMALAIILLWKSEPIPSMGNVLTIFGIGPLTIKDVYNLHVNQPDGSSWIKATWMILTHLSSLSLIFCLSVITRELKKLRFDSSLRGGNGWLFALAGLNGAAYLFVMIFMSGSLPMFDRYLLIFVPLLVMMLSQNATIRFDRRSPFVRWSAAALILFSAMYSVCATHDYLEWNRVRWQALNDLTNQQKISVDRIDGGYEFNGFLSYDKEYKQKPGKSWWWVKDDQYILAAGLLPGYTEFLRYPVKRWLPIGNLQIVVLRRTAPQA